MTFSLCISSISSTAIGYSIFKFDYFKNIKYFKVLPVKLTRYLAIMYISNYRPSKYIFAAKVEFVKNRRQYFIFKF